ncbi:PACE efflux transporter [Marinomonas flavescens]|uniref:PACE efflux transporter n=1 Tax=Marinomonas flavescens TaxID=2529379 RepID=UPI001054356C|nr:PACE efflux transporter [Marinomonas flavescens]
MKPIERIFHAILFEVLAVALAIIVLTTFTNHHVGSLSGTMIVVATIAMMWNFIYNWCFDRIYTGDKTQRSLVLRVVHTITFQAGLLVVTIPVIAFLLEISLWEALIMDIGVTICITLYAFLYNLIYDHTRAFIVQQRVIAN